MRKMLLALVMMFFMAGLVVAVEVTALSYDKDKKELKVKDGDDTKTFKVTDKTTFKRGEKDVSNEDGIKGLEKMNDDEKAKGKRKLEITTDKDNVTEIKMKGGKKKN